MKRGSSKGGPKRLGTFIAGNLTNALNSRLDEGLRLRRAWMNTVPEPLASHVNPVRYTAGLLFVHVDSSAWVSRLRHQEPALVASLRRNSMLRDLTSIRWKVVPRESDIHPEQVRPRTRLSAKAAQAIERTAPTITNPDLRAALERLAQRGGSPTTKRKP